ncbi:MAG: glycosyltransferase family 4 protein [Candidatus Omnitrophica bacterium]|jgi:glycosyltransferase involved in cell wall biosynthesis|nr:glycosyltransferase family 4 protein [Candidatus Omnitrophota bacterium]MDD5079314.1 glycosyltransferase family 4 protein [Candidatus Omnitrophota bacterium]
MNILFLNNHLNVGGITSYLLSLSRGLKERGHKVYIASSPGDCLTRFTEQGIVYVPIPIRTKSELNVLKMGMSLFRLIRAVKEKGIDVVHSNTRVTQVLGTWLSRCTGKPHITTWHGFFKNRLSRKVFPCKAMATIAISESVRDHLINDFGYDQAGLRLVYNGIDTEKLKLQDFKSRKDVKREFGLKDGPVVGIVARLSEVKGQAYLIRAMKLALNKVPDAQLFIVGEGRTEKGLKRLVREQGMSDSVVFLAKSQNIPQVLYVMDVFVMPSLNEGLGLGLMEAMAWAKPVIGSRVGGILNLVSHGQNGLLVNPADVPGLCSAIVELINDPVKASSLGNNARIFVNQRFSMEKMVVETERIYQECVDKKD